MFTSLSLSDGILWPAAEYGWERTLAATLSRILNYSSLKGVSW